MHKNPILISSVLILVIFSIWIFADTPNAIEQISDLSLWIREVFGRFYLWLGFLLVVFIVVIAALPLGKSRLDASLQEPEYSTWSWVSMLFSAGMGSGLILRAVQEPVYFQQNPPYATDISNELFALQYTFYHWGFTPWAIYGTVALIIAYSGFQGKSSLLMSSALNGTINAGWFKKSVDVASVVATCFGVVAAVTLGVTQITGGLNHLLPDFSFSFTTTIFFLILIAGASMLSALMGVSKGIKLLSSLNISITLVILAFVFLQSDILAILRDFISAFWYYIVDFIPMSLALGDSAPDEAFLTDWTYFYWAFWIAWAPFTGIFIARISRGRTIREFVIGILLIPSIGTFFWFSTFGNASFEIISSWESYNGEFSSVFSSVFLFFENYPLQGLMNIVVVVVLITYLITSIDSAIFVLSMFTDNGKNEPHRNHKLIWGIVLPLISIAILTLGNVAKDIDVLSAISKILIITSLPFAFIMALICAAFIRRISRNPSQ